MADEQPQPPKSTDAPPEAAPVVPAAYPARGLCVLGTGKVAAIGSEGRRDPWPEGWFPKEQRKRRR